MQLTGNSFIKHFLSFISSPCRPAHPTRCSARNFPRSAPGPLWALAMENQQRPQRQPRANPRLYRRHARSPGPAASSTPGSRLSPPGPGRARRRSGAPAAPGAAARALPACTGPHSRSRGSTPPRRTGELKNSTGARSPREPSQSPGTLLPPTCQWVQPT